MPNASFSQEWPLILASSSPRRKDLLASLGVPFKVLPSTIDEKSIDTAHLPPEEQVRLLAKAKGESVASTHPDFWVLGADTLVAIEGNILGKPSHPDEAAEMLQRLQGQWHTVHSAIALSYQGQCRVADLRTRVKIRPMRPDEILAYIQTGEPMDKAGAYAIQGHGSLLVECIAGCYFNVVGLSLFSLGRLLQEMSGPDL